ncbi:hypothetical protein GCM10019059_36670 [Camelimonas fluminis]|uniref:GSU2403 family nucleotidyltransferase fold protein n=1 Tax=Camelimonas fluminis TaxID=1576911 RepID=A0ABV7UID2_9HYPH|nr:GSU2403 family nucleotidyltransferase fold protein [Camelimonas fluminis]GHE73818.1 hypothetical protein GCM10019059_36670 [Camelimonas fluminis]
MYVGRFDDPEITRRVEKFKELKAAAKERRQLVRTLVREANLPAPEVFVGRIVEALAKAGFFRLRGVLVGTVAYQCYSAMLGIRLPQSAMMTADPDFAQFHSISVAVDDEMPPVLETLASVDPSFRPIPSQADSHVTTQFITRNNFKVEFLTPNRGSDDLSGKPALMPALGGASAQPLRFLDFLIYQPMRAALLHGAGVPVMVPAPERYAVHKLIIAQRRLHDRDGSAKSQKDLMQAAALMGAFAELGMMGDLCDAYVEAYQRGPVWRELLEQGLQKLPKQEMRKVLAPLAHELEANGHDPAEFGLGHAARFTAF